MEPEDDTKEINIDIDEEVFDGELLDIGFNNNGVLYNGYKYFNKDFDVGYINGREDKDLLEKNFYDSCTLMFTLSNIYFNKSKEKLFKEIKEYMKKDAYIYIWDIDKRFNKSFNKKITIKLPNNIKRDLWVKNFNVLKDSSKDSTVKIVEKYYDILEVKNKFGIYFIKAKNSK